MKHVNIFKNVLLLIWIVILIGCAAVNGTVTTESGKELSKSFKSVNIILDGSREFYNIAMSTAGEAYKKGYIADSQKNEIIKYATTYKRLHNDAVQGVLNWYDAIENEDDDLPSVRENAIRFLFEMTESGKELNRLIVKYTGKKIDIPEHYIPTFFSILKSLEPILSSGGK